MFSTVCVFVVSIVHNLIYRTAVLSAQTHLSGMECEWLGTRLPQAVDTGSKMKLAVYTLAQKEMCAIQLDKSGLHCSVCSVGLS